MDASLLKKEIRSRHLKQRAMMSDDEYLQRSQSICAQLISLFNEEYVKSAHVFLPIIGRKEPDINPFIQHLIDSGVTVVVPVAQAHSRVMNHSIITKETVFESGVWGEPIPKQTNWTAFEHYDMILIPMLAVDRNGYRLGYGKGYYDHFLKSVRGKRIGVCFENERYENLPLELHDQPVDLIVTELNTITISDSF